MLKIEGGKVGLIITAGEDKVQELRERAFGKERVLEPLHNFCCGIVLEALVVSLVSLTRAFSLSLLNFLYISHAMVDRPWA